MYLFNRLIRLYKENIVLTKKKCFFNQKRCSPVSDLIQRSCDGVISQVSQLSRSGADFDPLAPPYNSLAYFKTINLSASLYIPCRKREERFFTGIPALVSNQIIEIIPPSSSHSPGNSTPINGCLTDDRTVNGYFCYLHCCIASGLLFSLCNQIFYT